MPTVDGRPGRLDAIFRPGDDFTVTLTGPAGWLSTRVFTATLGGVALAVSESTDDLVIVASAAITTAASTATQAFVLTETGGQDALVGKWTPRTDGSLHSNLTADVIIDTVDVAVTILGGGGGSITAGDTSVTVSGSAVEITKPQPIYDATGTTILGYVGEGDPAGEPGGIFFWRGDTAVPVDYDNAFMVLYPSGSVWIQNGAGGEYLSLGASGSGFGASLAFAISVAGQDRFRVNSVSGVSMFSGTGIDGTAAPSTLVAALNELVDLGVLASHTVPEPAGAALVSDTAYTSSWNGVTGIAPSKNAVYDKIESIPVQLQMPGLWGWWSPRYVTHLADASRLRQLGDLSGNGRDLTTSTSANEQPTFETVEVNGNPVARFDGTKGAFTVGGATTAAACRFLHGTAWTSIFVYEQTAAASGTIWDTNSGSSTTLTGTWCSFVTASSALRVLITFASAGNVVADITTSASSFTTGTPHIVVVRYGYGMAGNDLTVEIDGVLAGSSDSVNAPLWNTDPSGGGVGVGQRSSGLDNRITGDLAELMFFSRRLSDAEVLTITGALQTTYGL